MADEKRRAGRDVPFLNWRYILFVWNDSDEEMALARKHGGRDRRRSPLLGDHRPPRAGVLAAVRRGHAGARRDSAGGLGRQQPRATPFPARRRARASTCARSSPAPPLVARAGRPLTIRTRVRNLSTRAFPAQATYGRRLVRLGAQLCDAGGRVVNRDFARAWLPGPLAPGARADVPIEIAAPAEPGRYQLKFDLVSEGIDWFERCGSPTTTRPLRVR